MPANDPCASRVIVNVPIKTSRYRAGLQEGKGDENVDVIKFPFRSSLRFATTDGKKEDKERERETAKKVEEVGVRGEKEGKSDAASGPSWRKGEFPAISLSVTAAQRGARHQRRVKVIAAGCTSPILALRAANKPFRLFDTRNSVFLAIVLAPGGKKKKNFAVGISDDWLKINVASLFFSLSLFSLFFPFERKGRNGQRISSARAVFARFLFVGWLSFAKAFDDALCNSMELLLASFTFFLFVIESNIFD